MDDGAKRIDQALDRFLPSPEVRPGVLHEAMRYAVLSGGKRFRPLLCLAASEAVGGSQDQALVPAAAIELLHAYTLVHDDLPAMDDDDLRRGRPTVHIQYGEANAILAGDALQTLAFEVMGSTGNSELVVRLAQATGSQGTVAGQVEDMAFIETANKETLEFIHLTKTASLISVSAEIGGLVGGGSEAEVNALKEYGNLLGISFQLVDDVLDRESEEVSNAVAVFGLDKTRERAVSSIDESKKVLSNLSGDTKILTSLADFILSRMDA